mgnify:FL=1
MKNTRLVLTLKKTVGCWSAGASLPSTQPGERQLTGTWSAQWICDGGSSPYDYGVYRFRKRLDLPKKPERFVINISADNRYRLLVNGQEACWGPARGDLNRWYYETVDIAPLLRPGQNVLAVTVWNLGTRSPGAQISRQTGLIVQGNSSVEDDVNTDGSWLVLRDESFSPLFNCPEAGYIGGHDRIDGTKYPWGWETVGFDDSKWYAATGFSPGKTYGAPGYGESDWILTPRDIPMMELTEQRLTAVRRQQGLASLPTFIDGRSPLKIPARTKCTVLLDQGFLTTAYPELKVSGGKGSKIKLTYSEALFDERGKGNRNEIDGRECRGFADEFLPDGADGRLFRPLWFKTYRYIQLDIETGAAPLVVEDLYGIYTGYPFEVRGSFESDDPALEKIWETGWRTARLCAHETYFDCPYYEQLQYAGDTRIQALISLYVSGDDRLVRKAIRMYDLSRSYEGITCSRYPSHIPQYIPPFSLYWIGMIHDYWMHRSDDAFVRSFLPGIRTVLSWFTEKIDPHTGLLKNGLPHWNFTDWATSWERGIAPESDSSGSAITTLQLAAALDDAADLMRRYDRPAEAKEYAAISAGLKKNVYEKCWDASKGLLRDYIGSPTYSQHVNIMGILTDAIPHKDQRAVFERIDSDPSLTQTTFYYKFYLIRALKKVGLADRYTEMLGPWQQMIDIGLTTFAETPEPTRSDCHAWSSSPNYDLLATVCGVEPASPGFATVRIAPHPGRLKQIKGVVPHPQGDITVELQRDGDILSGQVALPGQLTGDFVWNGKTVKLHPGVNPIRF